MVKKMVGLVTGERFGSCESAGSNMHGCTSWRFGVVEA